MTRAQRRAAQITLQWHEDGVRLVDDEERLKALTAIANAKPLTKESDMDTRNIQDKYRGWETDLISEDLNTTRSGFISVFLNVQGDFNKASGVRNLNWFNGQEAIMWGDKKWDRRGSVGTHNYTKVSHADEHYPLIVELRDRGYWIVAAEITDDAKPLTTYDWPENAAVIFGEENAGVPKHILDQCDDVVYIPGRGSVRSLNVSTTSGIFLYDFSLKRGLI